MYLSYYYSVLAQRFCFLYTSSDTAGGHPHILRRRAGAEQWEGAPGPVFTVLGKTIELTAYKEVSLG